MKQAEATVGMAVLMPHAPVLVPGVGGEKARAVRRSIDAMSRVARRIVDVKPTVLVVVSPHAVRRRGRIPIYGGDRLRGSLAAFGAGDFVVELPVAREFVGHLDFAATRRGMATHLLHDADLDHGAMVPLWHLQREGWGGPVAVVGFDATDDGNLTGLGRAIADAAARERGPVVVVASGDLSHRLRPGAPSGYDPRAAEFDRALMDGLRSGELSRLRELDPELRDLAAEDALDSIWVAASAVDWDSRGHEELSYEGPFGVGYGVAILYRHPSLAGPPGSEVAGGRALVERRRGGEPVRIARRSLEAAFQGETGTMDFDEGGVLAEHRAVFVTLRDREGNLRGCVGNLKPRFRNVAEETWNLAREAAFRDQRFGPLSPEEWGDTRIEVSVVDPLEEVASVEALDPRRYGVVAESPDGRRGALLPDIEGIDSVARQLAIVRRKAGIEPSEPVRLWRFTVRKFLEADDREGRNP